MYIWTAETRAIMDEVRGYVKNGKALPNAPEGTQEKYDRMRKLLDEERERQLKYMGY